MRLRKRLASIGLNALAWLLSLVVLIPFVVIVLNSFKSDAEAKVLKLTLPEKFIFENYKIVYEQGHLGGSFSTVCCIPGLLLCYWCLLWPSQPSRYHATIRSSASFCTSS